MEHAAEAGELPVVTTAEQRVVKATEMERGKLLSDEPLPQVPTSRCQKVPQQPAEHVFWYRNRPLAACEG